MGISGNLSETLKRFYTLVYREGQESWDLEYLCFEKTSVGNSDEEGNYQGRSRLVVLRKNAHELYFYNTFLNFFLKPFVLIAVKPSAQKLFSTG